MPNYDKHVVHPPYKPGRRSEAVVPSGVAQYGQRVGNHFTNGGAGGRMESGYGGIVALNADVAASTSIIPSLSH